MINNYGKFDMKLVKMKGEEPLQLSNLWQIFDKFRVCRMHFGLWTRQKIRIAIISWMEEEKPLKTMAVEYQQP